MSRYLARSPSTFTNFTPNLIGAEQGRAPGDAPEDLQGFRPAVLTERQDHFQRDLGLSRDGLAGNQTDSCPDTSRVRAAKRSLATETATWTST